jgi:hypothetical protein
MIMPMSINNKEHEHDSDLGRSSWEGMANPEISHEVATFVFAVQKKFLSDSNILDLEDAAIELVLHLDERAKESVIKSLKEIGGIGIRGCLQQLIPSDELLKIDNEETKRLIYLLQYADSTAG